MSFLLQLYIAAMLKLIWSNYISKTQSLIMPNISECIDKEGNHPNQKLNIVKMFWSCVFIIGVFYVRIKV